MLKAGYKKALKAVAKRQKKNPNARKAAGAALSMAEYSRAKKMKRRQAKDKQTKTQT